MNNTYTLTTNSTITAIEAIDNFITKMSIFESKYKGYTHQVSLNNVKHLWQVELIIKNEKENIRTL